jgi:hypothetical protein
MALILDQRSGTMVLAYGICQIRPDNYLIIIRPNIMKPPQDLLHVAYVDSQSTYRHLSAPSAMSIQEIYTDDESRVAKSGLEM